MAEQFVAQLLVPDAKVLESLYFTEIVAAAGDTAALGQIWVKNDVPNTLWFTNDAGTDVQLGIGASSLTIGDGITSGTLNRVLYEGAGNLLAESAGMTYDGTDLTLAGFLTVNKTSEVSKAEVLQEWKITDSATAKIQIKNNTTTNGAFAPTIYGATGSVSFPGFTFIGDVAGFDSGAIAAFAFQGRAGTGVTARDIVSYANYGTSLGGIDANGGSTTIITSATTVGQTIKLAATPTADAFLITDSADAELISIDKDGYVRGSRFYAGSTFLIEGQLSHNSTMDYFADKHTFRSNASLSSGRYYDFTPAGSRYLQATSGTQDMFRIVVPVNQTSTAGYNGLNIEVTETATGSGTKKPLVIAVAASEVLSVDNTGSLSIGGLTSFKSETDNTISANAVTVDWNAGNCQMLTMAASTGAVACTFTAPPSPCHLTLKVVQDAGPNDITFTPTLKWDDTVGEPTWSGDTSKTRIVGLYFDGTSYWASATNTYT